MHRDTLVGFARGLVGPGVLEGTLPVDGHPEPIEVASLYTAASCGDVERHRWLVDDVIAPLVASPAVSSATCRVVDVVLDGPVGVESGGA